MRAVRGQHGRFEKTGDATRDDVRAAQIRLGECDQYRSVVVAGREVDRAHEARDQARRVDAGARVKWPVESKSRERKRLAAVARFGDALVQIAKEIVAR